MEKNENKTRRPYGKKGMVKSKRMSVKSLIARILMCAMLVAVPDGIMAQENAGNTGNANKVLVLSSYFHGYVWAGTLESAIVSHFAKSDNWNVEVDYLDLVANRDSVYMRQKAEKLMSEHKAERKNIVVLLGEEAWIMYQKQPSISF